MSNIAVTHVKQTYSYWCWAACCEMFVRRYDPASQLNQAAFAHQHNLKFGHGMNAMADYSEVAWLLKNVANRQVERVHGPLEWDNLRATLNNCRLVIASAANHAWLIVGCENDSVHGQIVWVHDPGRDSGPNKSKYSVFKALWLTSVVLSQQDSEALD